MVQVMEVVHLHLGGETEVMKFYIMCKLLSSTLSSLISVGYHMELPVAIASHQQ